MEDLWCGFSDALSLLGVTAQHLNRYAKEGVIRETKTDGKRLFLRQDVQDVNEARERIGDVRRNPLRVAVLLVRLERTERFTEHLMEVIGHNPKPVNLDIPTAIELYRACVLMAAEATPSIDKIRYWTYIIDGLRQDHFEMMTSLSKQPWRIFLQLVDSFISHLADSPLIETELLVQILHDRLLRARRSLRQEIVVFEAVNQRDLGELAAAMCVAQSDIDSWINPADKG